MSFVRRLRTYLRSQLMIFALTLTLMSLVMMREMRRDDEQPSPFVRFVTSNAPATSDLDATRTNPTSRRHRARVVGGAGEAVVEEEEEPCRNYTPPDATVLAARNRAAALLDPIPSMPIVLDGASTAGFTVLMLVFSRAAVLQELVVHYACMSAVDKIIVLWAPTFEPPAMNVTSDAGKKCVDKLVMKRVRTNSLADRFKPYREINTDAVFSVDDDQLLHESDMERAFKVWMKHPYGIVGFNHRRFVWTAERGYSYTGKLDVYHFILTNSAFVHRSYLELFDYALPLEIRNSIDERMNCEDLAMNVLVGNFCRCTIAFHVDARRGVAQPRSGPSRRSGETLSSRPGHFAERGDCLNRFAKYYGWMLLPNFCTY